MPGWKPEAYPSLSPYLSCPDAEGLLEFLGVAFGGEVQRRFDHPDGSLMHAEVRIDDSVVMVGGGADASATSRAHIHLYCADAVAVFERAIAAGASAVRPPERKTADDDLRGGVQDRWGTTWWIATQ